MLVTFEGTDGVGKSSVLHGSYDAQGNHVRGVAQLLEDAGRSVVLTKEPGTAAFRAAELPTDVATVDFMLWLAARRCASIDPRQAVRIRYILHRVRIAHRMGEATQVWSAAHFKRPLPTRPKPPGLEHDDQTYRVWLQARPDVKRALVDYTTRDAIRHALFHASDSRALGPTSNGLLFLANHLAHQAWLVGLGAWSSVIISDRYAESQMVYGPLRGTHEVVYELYETWATLYPHHVFLLTADPDEIEARLATRSGASETSKQQNKTWNEAEFRAQAQRRYDDLMELHPSPWTRIDTTGRTPGDLAVEIATRIQEF
jgi:thymidylate kinase